MRFTRTAITSRCTCRSRRTHSELTQRRQHRQDEGRRAHAELCPRRPGQQRRSAWRRWQAGKVAAYATDFADETLLDADERERDLAMPHLGASTPECEDNCARMAADGAHGLSGERQHPQLREPAGRFHAARRQPHLHSAPAMCRTRSAASPACWPRAASTSRTWRANPAKTIAYTILDVTGDVSAEAADSIASLEEVVRVRVIK